MQVCTSEHVAGLPSSWQPQPNCEHHPCWPFAIDLYVSDVVVTRVPSDAHADNSAVASTASSIAFFVPFIVGSFRPWSRPADAPVLGIGAHERVHAVETAHRARALRFCQRHRLAGAGNAPLRGSRAEML